MEPKGFREMIALRALNVKVAYKDEDKLLAKLKVKPMWSGQITEAQTRGPFLRKIKDQLDKGKYAEFNIGAKDKFEINGRIYVPRWAE